MPDTFERWTKGPRGLVVGRASKEGRQSSGGGIGHRFNSAKHVAWVRGRLGRQAVYGG